MNLHTNFKKAVGSIVMTAMLAMPLAVSAQTYHETAAQRHARAVRSQRAHDRRHHTTAKVVGGSAAGGAVIGAVAGGGKGALIGGGIGAVGGLVANKIRKDQGVKKREEEGR